MRNTSRQFCKFPISLDSKKKGRFNQKHRVLMSGTNIPIQTVQYAIND